MTAADTNAGKTWASIYLIRRLQAQGKNALAIKPIVSGYQKNDPSGDVQRLLAAQTMHDVDAINRYRFTQPAAPSIAAASESKHIKMVTLLTWCETTLANIDHAIIEGVGGIMVPLNHDSLVLDWMQALALTHILLCVEWKLGCINHALLSVAALQSRGMTPDWVLLNQRQPIHDSRHAAAMCQEICDRLPKKTRILQAGVNEASELDIIFPR
ncbi:MAG: dethiobiotin synthase [Mariprofundaceae bacterium]|nr:dethiobiotin synthase [Mariprofundaceae bacterium]